MVITEHWKWFIMLNVSGKILCNLSNLTLQIIGLTCDWMDMTMNDVKSVSSRQKDSDFNCIYNES